ncbi:mevalonate kinase-like [Haliotis rufescens]|uniref:mevalonate kinase-like n=1 Tax=Haliotis rufescens TaxID=6454 RepID=UPI00201EE8AF|nr:mevalonate kinase-like [Haliotis rufescens]
MGDITVSAPGKVILHGEHAVVYGKVAIAASLNLRTYLRMRRGTDNLISLDLPNIAIKKSWTTDGIKSQVSLPLCDPNKPVGVSGELLTKLKDIAGVDQHESDTKQLAVITFLYLYCALAAHKGTLPAIGLKVVSVQPVSAGLGSSASFSVCLAASLLQLSGIISSPAGDEVWSEAERDLINSWAFFGEKILHGNPSGIDNSVSTYGGAIKFKSGKITPLCRVPKLQILLVNTGVPRSTKVLVARCRERYQKYPDIIEPVLKSIEAISHRCEEVLAELADSPSTDLYETLEDLIDINQHHLGALCVNHPALEEIVRTAAKYGLHAKLTGAGGGGCAFIFIKPDTPLTTLADIKSEFASQKLSCWETSVGSPGVTAHSGDDGHLKQLFS